MSSKTTSNGIKVPWYGYLFLFLVYASSFIVMTPFSLISGLFSAQEMGIIFASPLVNIVILLVLALAGAAGAIYAVYVGIKMARADSAEAREENKKRLINIIVTIVVVIVLIVFFNSFLPAILSAFKGNITPEITP